MSHNSRHSLGPKMERGLLSPSKIGEFTNSKIHKSLLTKLEKARQQIAFDNDLFINKDHELLCSYYNKVNELKKRLDIETKHINLTYRQNVLIGNNEPETFLFKKKINEKLDFSDTNYTYKIKYNTYNHKFINKIQHNIDANVLQEFMNKQNQFIESLTLREICVLKYYTYHGDVYINAYIDGMFVPSMMEQIGGGIVDDGSDLCYFFYQFLDYFSDNKYYNGKYVPVTDDVQFIQFLSDNYLNFDANIYDTVFDQYIKEFRQLFDKAPRMQQKLLLYRGIDTNYVLKKSSKGYYKTNHFSSTSLFAETALKYTKPKNRMMLKIIVDENLPLIFVEGVSLARGDFEVIIPINATLYIDYAMKKINYYKNTNDIICPDVNADIVNMSTVLYSHYDANTRISKSKSIISSSMSHIKSTNKIDHNKQDATTTTSRHM
jgi:hypothetical protein